MSNWAANMDDQFQFSSSDPRSNPDRQSFSYEQQQQTQQGQQGQLGFDDTLQTHLSQFSGNSYINTSIDAPDELLINSTGPVSSDASCNFGGDQRRRLGLLGPDDFTPGQQQQHMISNRQAFETALNYPNQARTSYDSYNHSTGTPSEAIFTTRSHNDDTASLTSGVTHYSTHSHGLTSALASFQFEGSNERHGQYVSDPTSNTGRNAQPQGEDFRCSHPDCSHIGRNKSEYMKHKNRHDKPFKCTLTGCGKAFSTDNDLDRHQVNVHKQPARKGVGKYYVCFYENCPSDKKWSRLDNFKVHLRLHLKNHPDLTEDVLDEWVKQSVHTDPNSAQQISPMKVSVPEYGFPIPSHTSKSIHSQKNSKYQYTPASLPRSSRGNLSQPEEIDHYDGLATDPQSSVPRPRSSNRYPSSVSSSSQTLSVQMNLADSLAPHPGTSNSAIQPISPVASAKELQRQQLKDVLNTSNIGEKCSKLSGMNILDQVLRLGIEQYDYQLRTQVNMSPSSPLGSMTFPDFTGGLDPIRLGHSNSRKRSFTSRSPPPTTSTNASKTASSSIKKSEKRKTRIVIQCCRCFQIRPVEQGEMCIDTNCQHVPCTYCEQKEY